MSATSTHRRFDLVVVLGVFFVTMVTACGGSDASDDEAFAGYRLDPTTVVANVALPELTSGTDRTLTASLGKLAVVYFGYTSCPDFCPTTMSNLRLARNRLDDPAVIEPAMVTIDPHRDLPVLTDYVGSFFDDGAAFGTDDPAVLAAAAAPFGVTYSVEPNPEAADDPQADPFLVTHSTLLYAVNDQGMLVLTWPFGVTIDDLTHDLELLIDEQGLA